MNSNDPSSGSAKPSIIDLEAETISDESNAANDPPPQPPPPPAAVKRRARRWLWPALALGIAAVAGGWIYKDVLESYFPSDALKQANARIETLEAQTKTLNDQLTALANQSEQLKGISTSSQSAADTANATARDAASKAADLEGRVANVENSTQSIKDEVAKLATTAPAATFSGSVDANALGALAQRLDAVEKDVASLKTQRSPNDTVAVTSALSQALSDLKAKIAAGAPYKPEYDRIVRMVPAAAGLDVLQSHAAEGLPNAKGLAEELRREISLLPKPEVQTETDEGYLSSLWSALGSVVTVKNVGDTDLPALAGRAADLAESGDLTGAIALIDAMEGERPLILTQWRDRVQARLLLDQSLDQTAAAVLQQITSMGSAQ